MEGHQGQAARRAGAGEPAAAVRGQAQGHQGRHRHAQGIHPSRPLRRLGALSPSHSRQVRNKRNKRNIR